MDLFQFVHGKLQALHGHNVVPLTAICPLYYALVFFPLSFKEVFICGMGIELRVFCACESNLSTNDLNPQPSF